MSSDALHVPFVDLRRLLARDRDDLVSAFERVLDSGRFVLGPALDSFEGEFAEYCGSRHAVGVGNGLDALYLALRALGIGQGDEVIVPALTFVATWIAVTRCGATPVPAEPDPKSYLMTADAVRATMTPRTRAVVAVHLYGSIHGIEDIAAVCRERSVALVEDAAQAHGARSGGVHAGSFGAAGCFSFYPSKNLGCLGDGGMVVTNDDAVAARVRSGRNYGSRAKYEHDEEGMNSRLDEVQAALLSVRLRRLDGENARRRQVAAIYLERMAGIEGIGLPLPGHTGTHAWHLFVVHVPWRDDLQRFLAERGIHTLVHYPRPVYRFAPFAAFAPATESTSDRLTRGILSLPMGPHVGDSQAHAVCDAVLEFAQRAG